MEKTTREKEILKEFEDMKTMVELRALSKISLLRPLNYSENNRMSKLKKEVGL